MEEIHILKKPRLKNPHMIVAWPGMGDVAFKAGSYLVEKLRAEEFASLSPGQFFYFTGSLIHEGILTTPDLPQNKFYFWKNPAARTYKQDAHDLIIFLSNAQPDLTKAQEYSEKILYVAKEFKVDSIISFASMPQALEYTQEPHVWLASTSAEMNKGFRKKNFNILTDGQVSGMNGLFLGLAKKQGFRGFCLLAEIPFYTIQIENPKASYALLRNLASILNIEIEFADLLEQVRSAETEIEKLLEYLKNGPGAGSGPNPIGEEEIEKIKKTLTQLTKLPISIKEKIEALFEQSKIDIAKAAILKSELDKWNVYKDYEDRFLDLFKKGEEKNN